MFGQVVYQMHHAVSKHGLVTRDHMRRIAILTEELGEFSEQALKATSNDPKERELVSYRSRINNMQEELGQLAGYAILVMMELERESGN